MAVIVTFHNPHCRMPAIRGYVDTKQQLEIWCNTEKNLALFIFSDSTAEKFYSEIC